MAITVTNRKGQTYYLCAAMTKSGKLRYVFTREPKGEALNAIPSGYHIEESANGIVSLPKDRPQLIFPDELAAIEAALKRHPQSSNYRVTVKQNQIVVYERQGPDIDALLGRFGGLGHANPQAFESLIRNAQYVPIMQFVLRDPSTRDFAVERWHFSGSIDDWIDIGEAGRIETLARALIPLLGTDAFFDLG